MRFVQVHSSDSCVKYEQDRISIAMASNTVITLLQVQGTGDTIKYDPENLFAVTD